VGDALVGANGYSLQGMDLEQAVGVMRTVSAVGGCNIIFTGFHC
jgi:hypothetical protein